MSSALDGLRQVVDALNPRTMSRLVGAGAFTLRSPLGLAKAMPWLVGRGPSLGIVSQINAVVVGDKVAIHDRAGSITWSELDAEANRAGRALLAAGVKPGDKIALLLRNGREMAAVALGGQKTGIIVCPLNTWAKTKELKAVMANLDTSLLIYDANHYEQVRE
ncbi:MAG TPA: AMP-binding protein, partial [Actinomycetota bacterium]|nr:AMP-binding protein [Actinomycetota bacterium]